MGHALLLEWFKSVRGWWLCCSWRANSEFQVHSVELLSSPGSGLGHLLSRGPCSCSFAQAGQRNLSFDVLQVLWCIRMLFAVGIAHPGCFHMESGRRRCLTVHPSCPAAQMFWMWGGESGLQSPSLGAVSLLLLWFLPCWQLVMVFSLQQHRAASCAKLPLFTLLVLFLSFVLLEWFFFVL